MIAEDFWVEISRKMDLRVKPLEDEIKMLHLKMENDYMPRLETLESVYTGTYERYVSQLEKQDRILDDIDVMKKALIHHSEQLEDINGTLKDHSEQLEAINRTLDEHNRKFDIIDKRFDELTELVTKNSRLIEENSSLIEKLINVVEMLSHEINVKSS